jgi:hypothetical protein
MMHCSSRPGEYGANDGVTGACLIVPLLADQQQYRRLPFPDVLLEDRDVVGDLVIGCGAGRQRTAFFRARMCTRDGPALAVRRTRPTSRTSCSHSTRHLQPVHSPPFEPVGAASVHDLPPPSQPPGYTPPAHVNQRAPVPSVPSSCSSEVRTRTAAASNVADSARLTRCTRGTRIVRDGIWVVGICMAHRGWWWW